MSEFKKPYMFLTRFEVSSILSKRATELSLGEPPKLSQEEIENLNYNPLAIAEVELQKRLIDYIIVRRLPQGTSLTFSVKEAAGISY